MGGGGGSPPTPVNKNPADYHILLGGLGPPNISDKSAPMDSGTSTAVQIPIL